jgi:hypothetical protein
LFRGGVLSQDFVICLGIMDVVVPNGLRCVVSTFWGCGGRWPRIFSEFIGHTGPLIEVLHDRIRELHTASTPRQALQSPLLSPSAALTILVVISHQYDSHLLLSPHSRNGIRWPGNSPLHSSSWVCGYGRRSHVPIRPHANRGTNNKLCHAE